MLKWIADVFKQVAVIVLSFLGIVGIMGGLFYWFIMS